MPINALVYMTAGIADVICITQITNNIMHNTLFTAFRTVTMDENFSGLKHHPKITGVIKREHIISENSRAT